MAELTAKGKQAQDIADRYWDSPEAGLIQIRRLAISALPGSQELREIQDAGTMLSRRASSTMPVTTISGQVAGAD